MGERLTKAERNWLRTHLWMAIAEAKARGAATEVKFLQALAEKV